MALLRIMSAQSPLHVRARSALLLTATLISSLVLFAPSVRSQEAVPTEGELLFFYAVSQLDAAEMSQRVSVVGAEVPAEEPFGVVNLTQFAIDIPGPEVPTEIFIDGFENEDTSFWSAVNNNTFDVSEHSVFTLVETSSSIHECEALCSIGLSYFRQGAPTFGDVPDLSFSFEGQTHSTDLANTNGEMTFAHFQPGPDTRPFEFLPPHHAGTVEVHGRYFVWFLTENPFVHYSIDVANALDTDVPESFSYRTVDLGIPGAGLSFEDILSDEGAQAEWVALVAARLELAAANAAAAQAAEAAEQAAADEAAAQQAAAAAEEAAAEVVDEAEASVSDGPVTAEQTESGDRDASVGGDATSDQLGPDSAAGPLDGSSQPQTAPAGGGGIPIAIPIAGSVAAAAAGVALAAPKLKKGRCAKERKAVESAKLRVSVATEIADKSLERLRSVLADAPPKPESPRPLTQAHKDYDYWYQERYITALNAVSESAKTLAEAERALRDAEANLRICEKKPVPPPPPEPLTPPPPMSPNGFKDFKWRTVSGAEGGEIIGAGLYGSEIKDPNGAVAHYTFFGAGFTVGLPLSGFGPSPSWSDFTTTEFMFVDKFQGWGRIAAAGAYAGAGAGVTTMHFACGDLDDQKIEGVGGGTGVGGGASYFFGYWEYRD